jgi:uncharacterized membrane protein YeiH
VMRDVLVSEVPVVLRADVYAVAALAGASVVVVGDVLQLPSNLMAVAGAGLCFGIRIAAIYRRWHFPVARTPEPPDD